jgi:hypothetical protein
MTGASDRSLRAEVISTFERARARLGDSPSLDTVRRDLDEHAGRVRAPMSVAVVGRVSSGKSTLVNALLGEYRAPTGVQELTFNVNLLRHGHPPRVIVHFRDARPSEPRDIAELEALTVRAADDPRWQAYLGNIDHLEVIDPNPYLRAFDLVDTPGLDSHFGADSQNTLRFLGRTGEDVRSSTLARAARADAVVMTFVRGAHEDDAQVVADFSGFDVAGLGPLNAVGVLNRIDMYWDWEREPDPMRVADRVAEQIMAAPGMSRLLFAVLPLCGQLAAGAGACDERDLSDLRQLAGLPHEVLAPWVARGRMFWERPRDDVDVSAERRHHLVRRFSQYGVVLASCLVRRGVDEGAELREQLARRSGLSRVRALLADHFGNRSDVIKTVQVLRWARSVSVRQGSALPPRPRAALNAAVGEFTALELRESAAFDELRALRDLYDGSLTLSPQEAEELRRLTGEHGRGLLDRIDLPDGATGEAMRRRVLERLAHWSFRAVDPDYAGATGRAVRIIRRSYEAVLDRIDAPRRPGSEADR